MGSPKYWLAIPIVAPAMQITTETWNSFCQICHLLLGCAKFIWEQYKLLFIQNTVALGSTVIRSKTLFFWHGTLDTFHRYWNTDLTRTINMTIFRQRCDFDRLASFVHLKNKKYPQPIFWHSSDRSYLEANYLVVELEGPVVDVDLLKLEVVDEVLEHVRHPAKL